MLAIIKLADSLFFGQIKEISYDSLFIFSLHRKMLPGTQVKLKKHFTSIPVKNKNIVFFF